MGFTKKRGSDTFDLSIVKLNTKLDTYRNKFLFKIWLQMRYHYIPYFLNKP